MPQPTDVTRPPAPPHGSETPSDATSPNGAPSEKSERVRAMFSSIAARYDLLNRVLSLGVDAAWRRDAVREAATVGPADVLDVATGTADLALALKRALPRSHVVGVDFAEPMLAVGRRKAARRGIDVSLERGDGTALRFPDASFDVVTIAYGLRNFDDIDRGLQEFQRVLRPGGKLVVLEFPPPPAGPLGRAFRFYFQRVLPVVGGMVSGDDGAYAYLPRSVLAFPPPERLAAHISDAGFTSVRYKLQTFGISALHVARKPAGEPAPASRSHPQEIPRAS